MAGCMQTFHIQCKCCNYAYIHSIQAVEHVECVKSVWCTAGAVNPLKDDPIPTIISSTGTVISSSG
jgi:hypothetical protein